MVGLLIYASDTSTASSDPEFASAPGEATTGVPDGIQLSPSGSVKVTLPGSTIDALDVSGSIQVLADNVTITNSRVDAGGSFYGIKIASGVQGLTIADTEIFGARSAAVSYGEYDATRLNVHSSRDGFLAGTNATIRDSWIHDLQSRGSGVKTVGGANSIIVGNHIEMDSGSSGAAIQIRADHKPLEHWLVQGNFLTGGKQSVYFDARRHDAINVQFFGNLFMADSWRQSASYLKASPSVWSENRTTNAEAVTTSRNLDERFAEIKIPENNAPPRTVGSTVVETTTTATPRSSITVSNPTTTSAPGKPPTPNEDDVYLSFDGDNDFVSLGNLDIPGSELTIEAMVNPQGFANCRQDDCRVVSKATGTSTSQHTWMLSTIAQNGETKLRFRLTTEDSSKTLVADSGAVRTGQWHHAAATYDGSQMRLYLDGEVVGSTAMSGSIAQQPSVEAWIGGNPDGPGSRPWQGGIDEVRIWREARGQADIVASIDKRIDPGPTLVAYYPITSEAQVKDLTGNHNGRSGTSGETDDSDPTMVSGRSGGPATTTNAPSTTSEVTTTSEASTTSEVTTSTEAPTTTTSTRSSTTVRKPAPKSWEDAFASRDLATIRSWYASNSGIAAAGLTDGDLTSSDGVKTTHDGQVIDGLLVKGRITVLHDNVTIRNSKVVGSGAWYAISVPFANRADVTQLTVENVSIEGFGCASTGNCETAIMTWAGNKLTVDRTNIRGHNGGIRLHSGARVSYTSVADIQTYSGSHNTAMSTRGGSDYVISRNYLEGSSSSAVSLYSDSKISHFEATENVFNGGTYSVHGGKNKSAGSQINNIRFADNLFTKNYRYGPLTTWCGSCPGNVWSNNTHLDGTPAP